MHSHWQNFTSRRRFLLFALAWLTIGALGSAILVVSAIGQARETFETEARIAHRLLSQRTAEHEAILVTLRLLQPDAVHAVSRRLAAVYPQLLEVRMVPAAQGMDGELARLDRVDWGTGRFSLVGSPEAGSALAYALDFSLPLMVPWAEWPFGAKGEEGSAAVTLSIGDGQWSVHSPPADSALLRFGFRKYLAAASQPFELSATRAFHWGDLPWGRLALFWTIWSAMAAGALALWRQRVEGRRAEALLRLGQVSRLNALGQLAAGVAHELNQPLTAVLAGAQASRRLLEETPPELDAARKAMEQVAAQARRAADVVGRLRRCIDRSGGRETVLVDPAVVVRDVMQLLAPEYARDGVIVGLPSPGTWVIADPVALEQIVHNLASNALRALAGTTSPRMDWSIERLPGQRVGLRLRDNGPGLPHEVIQHLFEPFITTHPDGLGLGLSLCETLAAEMNGVLRHEVPTDGPGAVFLLELPAPEREVQS